MHHKNLDGLFYPTNFYLISAATDSEFAIRRSDTTNNAIYHIRGMQWVPGSHTALRYLRREEQKVVRMLWRNEWQKFTPEQHITEHLAYILLEQTAEIHPEQHIPE